MAFLRVNGVDLPCPSTGLEIIISTAVNSGRNANAEVIGEKVGRDVLKYNNLRWAWLTQDEWSLICRVFANFFVVAEVFNPALNAFQSIKMYPGDRSAEIYWLNDDKKTIQNFRNCKVNIIDCGILG